MVKAYFIYKFPVSKGVDVVCHVCRVSVIYAVVHKKGREGKGMKGKKLRIRISYMIMSTGLL